MKILKKPGTALYPCPVVLVTCLDSKGEANIITLAWVGTVCSKPPTIALGIRPTRYSHGLIERSKEFVVNIPSTKIVKETDFCGIHSGRDVDKFSKANLTKKEAETLLTEIESG